MVILGTRTAIGRSCFRRLGLARSVHRVHPAAGRVGVASASSMNESPAFTKMKAEGKTSKARCPIAFGQWKNLKIVILALFGLTGRPGRGVGTQASSTRCSSLTRSLKVDGGAANIMIALSLVIGTPFFIVFGAWSDKIGRKPIIMAGCLPAGHLLPRYSEALTKAANPDLAKAQGQQGGGAAPMNARSSSTPPVPQVHQLLRYRQVLAAGVGRAMTMPLRHGLQPPSRWAKP